MQIKPQGPVRPKRTKKDPEGPRRQKDPVSKGRLVKQLLQTQSFQAGFFIDAFLKGTHKKRRKKSVENSTLGSDPPLRTKVWKIFGIFFIKKKIKKHGLKLLKMA